MDANLAHILPDALLGVVVIAKAVRDVYRGRKRDLASARHLDNAIVPLTMRLDRIETDVRLGLTELKHFIVGPDGRNGLREEVVMLREDVKGLLGRERDRAEQRSLHANYDRRTE